jgi:hypothetical protein
MGKRQLNDEERKLTESNLVTLQEEMDYVLAMIKQKSTALEVAPVIYKQQVKMMEKEKKNWEQQLSEMKFTMESSKKMLEEGVEEVKSRKGGK